MKTPNEESIDQLNVLAEINNDRIQGYEKAIADTEDVWLKDLFRELAGHSRKHKAALSAEILKLGGQPTDKTRNSGKVFRAWMDIKAALTGKDKKAIISACEFGEDTILEVYDNQMKDNNQAFTQDQKELIMKQRNELQQDHDHVKTLKDSVKI